MKFPKIKAEIGPFILQVFQNFLWCWLFFNRFHVDISRRGLNLPVKIISCFQMQVQGFTRGLCKRAVGGGLSPVPSPLLLFRNEIFCSQKVIYRTVSHPLETGIEEDVASKTPLNLRFEYGTQSGTIRSQGIEVCWCAFFFAAIFL